MKKEIILQKIAVMTFCICMLMSSTLSLSNERTSNNQLDALGNPINDNSGITPQIDAPILAQPSNYAIKNDNTPTLGWYTVSGAIHYRFQVDDNSDFSSPRYDDFTDYTFTVCPTLADDYYYWRVRAYNFLGIWGSWSSVWHFTIDTTKPSAPVLISPSHRTTTLDATPFLDWSTVSDAVEYRVQADNNGDFSSREVDQTPTSSAYTCTSSLSDNRYYWRVCSKDAAGNWGDWSSVWYFTIDTTPPNPPSLDSPTNGKLINDDTPYLEWNPSLTAELYNLQVDDSASFSSPIVNVDTALTYHTCPTLTNKAWYWRVRAKDPIGNWGSWSSTWYFTVDTIPPGIPSLVSPTDGTITNDQTPYLDWSTVPDAIEYRVQVDNNGDFSSPIVDDLTSSTSYTCLTLGETIYHWRISARDAAENWGDWSVVWDFEIDTTPPSSLTLLSPNNSTIDNDPTPYLEWSSESGAILYQLQVDNDTDFLSTIIDIETIDTEYIATVLSDSVYYWRVRAKDAAENWGDWSVVWNFQIDTIAPTIINVGNNPTIPTNIDLVIFSCDVSDLNGIDLVILHYRINAGVWNDVSMALISGSTYQVSLGSFSYNDFIEYNISAFDTSINPNEAINDNGGLYFSFTVVSSDVTGPIINAIFNDPTSPTEVDTIAIYSNATDTNGIQSVYLYYRVNSTSWVSMSMTQVGSITYRANIGPFGYDDYIEYYIIAIDDSPNHNSATNDNSGLYYSFIISSSDIVGPIIDSVIHSPTNPSDVQTVTISSSITDSSGVQSVMLHYRVIGSLWSNKNMVLITGNTFEAVIGPFVYNAFIEYYITAIDNSPINNSAINDNSGVNYQFTIVSSDVTGPTISSVNHTPNTPNASETITISCSIIDTNGIQVVSLFYRVNSGSWVSVSMSLDTSDIYLATIGTFITNDTVEYYISATDDSPNQNVAIDDNENAYYSFTVLTPETPTTSTSEASLTLLIPFTIVALLSIIITRKKQ